MSFSSLAQEFVEELGKAPILKKEDQPAMRKDKHLQEDEQVSQGMAIPSLGKLLKMPEQLMDNVCKNLGMNAEYTNALICVFQSLVSTRENNLKPVQSRPAHWNKLFQTLTKSVVAYPASYDALLRVDESKNKKRLETDRSLMRVVILLHNAFAHRIEELREALLSYNSAEDKENDMKMYYQAKGNDTLAGEGPCRIDASVKWNRPICSRFVECMLIHMAFHREPDDGFDFFHIRPFYEDAMCGLFGSALFLGLLAAPSGVISVCISTTSFAQRFNYLLTFINDNCQGDSDWFYPRAAEMIKSVHSIVFYRPQPHLYPSSYMNHEEMNNHARMVLDHPIFETTNFESTRVLSSIGHCTAWHDPRFDEEEEDKEKEEEEEEKPSKKRGASSSSSSSSNEQRSNKRQR